MAGTVIGPKLSIIIPTYNSERTLKPSLESVLGQRFRDFEVLIMDGLSIDRTIAVAKETAKGDERVRIRSEKDEGIYDAMNKGIRNAAGEWIYFLGSDDRLQDPEVLWTFFTNPAVGSSDLVYGDVCGPGLKFRYDGVFSYWKLLSRNLSHQAAFYRKELFERLGVYNLRYRMHADWDFNLRCWRDPGVRTHYFRVLVAYFGAGGVSAGHDIPFLREKLIPAKLRALNETGPKVLRKIACYDEWWRFIRNAGFRSESQLQNYIGDQQVPHAIRRMLNWQRCFSSGALGIGALSKSWMAITFLAARLLGDLE